MSASATNPANHDKLVAALYRRLAERQPLPLTATQQGIWLAERLDPGFSGYHDVSSLRLSGPLDAESLRLAFARTQADHDSLRCRLVDVDGEPYQVFDAERLPWHEDDVSAHGENAEAATTQLAGIDATTPFDLHEGPPWRVRLSRCGADEHVLTVVAHHLVTDGWSHGLMFDSVLSHYGHLVHGTPAPRVPRRSFRDWLLAVPPDDDETRRRAVEVAERLADAPRRLRLAGMVEGSHGAGRADTAVVRLPDTTRAAFARACHNLNATEFMGFTGLFAALLASMADTSSIVVSMPVASRDDPANADVLGCLVDRVAVRIDVAQEASPHDAIRAGRDGMLAAVRDMGTPYRHVARALGARGDADDPVTNVSVSEFNVTTQPRHIRSLTVRPLPRRELRPHHDLTLSFRRSGAGDCELVFPADRWSASSVSALAEHLRERVAEAARHS